jgi:hypothetical protein
MAAASTKAWTSNCMAVEAPAASTTCPSWVRNSAATAVATIDDTPPRNSVPPSTTAAMVVS